MARKQLLGPMRTAPDQRAPRLANGLLWLCIPIGTVAVTVILLLFGVSLWPALGIAFLIGCPLAIIWVLVAERGLPGAQGRQ